MSEAGTETKQRILDAAEELFGERGFSATSLRAVIAEAEVNLAAVHYHFGSKEGLLRAVIHRKLDPLNQQRLALLDQYEAEAKGGSPPLRKLIEAFFAPMIRASEDPERGAGLMKLMGRVLSEPDFFLGKIAPALFQEVRLRFQNAFERALPELPPRELFWRMMFGIGAMAHTLRFTPHAEALSGGLCKKPDTERTVERVVTFVEAGLKAPVTGGVR